MSMYADVVNLVKSTQETCNITDDQAVVLLNNILDAVGWEQDDVDYDSDCWTEQERASARLALGISN